MKVEEKLPKEYIKGLQDGLRIAKDIAKKQGYEIYFPEIEDMKLERCEK